MPRLRHRDGQAPHQLKQKNGDARPEDRPEPDQTDTEEADIGGGVQLCAELTFRPKPPGQPSVQHIRQAAEEVRHGKGCAGHRENAHHPCQK